MNRNRRFACILGAAAVLLWAWPFACALGFYRESWGYLAETSSSDAGRDVDFSLSLLHSYTYSLAAAFGVTWCVYGTRSTARFILPAFIVLYAPVEILRLRPEEPIVLIPSMHPYRPAIISFVGWGIALGIRLLPRMRNLTPSATKAW